MSWTPDFVDLEDSSLVVIALSGFPRPASEEISIVKCGVVIAPIPDMLYRACSGDRCLPARALGDEPVGHIAAIAVTADGEMIGIGDAIFNQRIYAFQDVFAGSGDNLRHDLRQKLVAIAG